MLTHHQSSPWRKLLERPPARGHYVQLYQSGNPSLAQNVGLYLSQGLKSGDGVMVIASPEHREAFCGVAEAYGNDTRSAIATGQLVLLDAREMLSRFMVAGQPDWDRFEHTVRTAVTRLRPPLVGAGFRAYGEMVGILWKAHQFAAAVRMEQFWNRLLARWSFTLYCAYAVDIFGEEFLTSNFDGVLCTHTHLLPGGSNGNLDTALRLSMDEILGPGAEAKRSLTLARLNPSWTVMPDAEATVIWLRKNLPGQADEIVWRARRHYDLLSRQAGSH